MIQQDYKLQIWEDSERYYFYKNDLHRLGGPAILFRNEPLCYYVNGQLKSAEYFYQNDYEKND